MERSTNKRVLLAKIQATHGVDPQPTAADNAIEVSDLSVKPIAGSKKERKVVRPYFGAKPALFADQHMEISFKVELAGSGTAGVAPAFSHLLRACSLAEIVTAGTKVDYKPIVSNMEEVAFYYNNDGVTYKIINCKGNVSASLGKGNIPMLSFNFLGMNGGRVAESAPTSPVYLAFQTPLIVSNANSLITVGGTVYANKGFDVDLGNSVAFHALVGNESVRIGDRNTTGKMALDLPPADELAFLEAIENTGTFDLSFTHGKTAGNIVKFSAPKVQFAEPAEEDEGGVLLHGFSLAMLPLTGNDEILISFS